MNEQTRQKRDHGGYKELGVGCGSLYFYMVVVWGAHGVSAEVRKQFKEIGFFHTTWVSGLKLRSLGLAASTFNS